MAVAHLHNLTPVAFLWEWSRDRGTRLGRTLFRTAQLGWAAVIPIVVFAGAFDHEGWGWSAWSGDRAPAQVAAVYSPTGWSGQWPLRFLIVFCFGQLMHYVIWCGFLPAVARPAHRRGQRATFRLAAAPAGLRAGTGVGGSGDRAAAGAVGPRRPPSVRCGRAVPRLPRVPAAGAARGIARPQKNLVRKESIMSLLLLHPTDVPPETTATDGSNTWLVVGIVVVAVMAAIALAVLARRRRRTS